jgi:pyridoxal 5'-phosphate synthase pdxT subunit
MGTRFKGKDCARTNDALSRVKRRPTWGTCAGLILLAESANRTKKGGQELIGGLDVRVNRNHFGRQTESFALEIDLPFLASSGSDASRPFPGVFIRAPIVEKILSRVDGIQAEEAQREDTVIAPSKVAEGSVPKEILHTEVEVLATLSRLKEHPGSTPLGDIIAVKQGNCFGTSFHPELTDDARIHIWWLKQVLDTVKA